MSKHKVDFTRPDFLLKFISDKHCDTIDISELYNIIAESSDLLYCAYNVLIGLELPKNAISNIVCDKESIALYIPDKSLLKNIKDSYIRDTVVLGQYRYKIHTKVKNNTLIISTTIIEKLSLFGNDDEEEEE